MGGTTPLFSGQRQTNIEVFCGGRPSVRPGELSTQRQDRVNTIGLQKVCSLETNAHVWHAGSGTIKTNDECNAVA